MNPTQDKAKGKNLSQYEDEGNKIIRNMLDILVRAQRKVDNKAYRQVLEKLENKK